ncbi:MAG TPA: YifB family Mg chelatase-like AAA ATPase [Anaerolineae bacterium]|nr:YifB family Mg chelatase-like AAA ATPase [Anaerolineae bacterium]HQH38029.1 YifB family Mg chelatase-like AAA ATPase [Anaerolineae bacterium]
MLAKIGSAAVLGLEAVAVEVEVDVRRASQAGILMLVGLPDAAVRESSERTRAAIRNSGLTFPGDKHITINLAPADLRKEGPAYDLPIAIGILMASGQLPPDALDGAILMGELSLDGTLRHVRGVLPVADMARHSGITTLYVPAIDAAEAALIPGLQVYPVASLASLVAHLQGFAPIAPHTPADHYAAQTPPPAVDFAEIQGQEHAKRALEVAAAGGHNLLMVGPPGAGKTLMARALAGVLPQLSLEEALEVTRIYSVADQLSADTPLIQVRPFRAPHHTISNAGLVGGGNWPRPGEISLAHRGVLFLDELPEFNGHVLEMLRQPMEDKTVTISRAHGSLTFPASFMLVAAMNPCPCGYFGDSERQCTCAMGMIQRYRKRISGPLLDRIDIHMEVPRVAYDKLAKATRGEPSEAIRARIGAARERQQQRLAGNGLVCNADMGPAQIREFCALREDAQALMRAAMRQMHLSARAYHRILKVSRTIADLEGTEGIQTHHLAEALQYRARVLDM